MQLSGRVQVELWFQTVNRVLLTSYLARCSENLVSEASVRFPDAATIVVPPPPPCKHDVVETCLQLHEQLAKAMQNERGRMEKDRDERERAERDRVSHLLETQARYPSQPW